MKYVLSSPKTRSPFPATPTITPVVYAELAESSFVSATPTPTEKSGGGFFGFGNPPQQTDTDPKSPNPLIGITAAAVTGAYIATQRKKEVEFGSAPKEAQPVNAAPNILDGAQAIALMSAFTAKMEEDRQRRIAEKARQAAEAERLNILNYQAVQRRIQEIARAREEARRKREEAKRKQAARHPLQDLWDANGAAIYAANQSFKTAFGKDMDAATRKKAIKDATRNGHFNADAYAGNLVKAATPPPPPPNPYAAAADRIRAAANEIDDEKNIGYADSERDEVRKLIALNEQKNAPVDSATASYMAMAAATKGGNPYKMASPVQQDNDSPEECQWWQFLCRWRKSREEKKRQSVPTATPTSSVDAAYTQAAATIQAELTQTAQPTITPTPTQIQDLLVKICGTSPGGASEVGMLCEGESQAFSHLTAWDKDTFPDFEIKPEQYLGNIGGGKAGQALKIIAEVGNRPNVTLLGYSSGTHTALFVAELRTSQGVSTNVILMGSPMHNPDYPILAYDLAGEAVTEADYIERVQALADSDVNNKILIIDEYAHPAFQTNFEGYNGNIEYYPRPLAGEAHQIIDDLEDVAKDAHIWLTEGKLP